MEVLHAAVCAVTVGLVSSYLLFMLRPFLLTLTNESRRIAELLSQLPAEVSFYMSSCTPLQHTYRALYIGPSSSVVRGSACRTV